MSFVSIHLGVVHSDLKPANFIWVGDKLKIIDFGIASRLQQDQTSIAVGNPKGTINFMSPESVTADINGRAKVFINYQKVRFPQLVDQSKI